MDHRKNDDLGQVLYASEKRVSWENGDDNAAFVFNLLCMIYDI